MSSRDIRAAKIAVLIIAVVATFALVSTYISHQNAATQQRLEQLER